RVRDLERELVNMREDRDSWMERVTSNVSDNYFHEKIHYEFDFKI
ncbi:12226_t:CDS:2, partial [Racocetra fulgida]